MKESYCWCGSNVNSTGGCAAVPLYHDPLATGTTHPSEVRVLYIAGPMSGYDECNYPAFHEAARLLREVGYTVINPAEFGQNRSHYNDLIKMDLIEMLTHAEGIAVLPGWEASRGATNEVNVGKFVGMSAMSVEYWLDLD